MTRTKLTTLEKRAKEFAEQLKRTDPGVVAGRIAVKWSKSYTGCHARIENFAGDKVAFAGGGGYCKGSAVLSELLRWLFPADSEEHMRICRQHGAGENSVERTLEQLGWKLERVYSDKTTDVYSLAPVVK